MPTNDILKGKKILVVDDEPDVLDSLKEILEECDVDTASSFEVARDLLMSKSYDAAILDIMGVKGFDLLQIATDRGIPAMMLTAHGLTPDNLVGSIEMGAKSYIPKERMQEIGIYLSGLFRDKLDGIEHSRGWFDRLSSFFDKRFGYGWQSRHKKFSDEFDKTYKVSRDDLGIK